MCAPVGILGAIKNPKKAALGMLGGSILHGRVGRGVPGVPKKTGPFDTASADWSISL